MSKPQRYWFAYILSRTSKGVPMKILSIFVVLMITVGAQAQDWGIRYFDQAATVKVVSPQFDSTFDINSLQVHDAQVVLKSSMTGWGRQQSIFGRKLILKVRDHYFSKMFLVNGRLTAWNQTSGVSIRFLGDDFDGNDLIEIFVPTSEREIEIVFLEDYRRVTPHIGNPSGYTGSRYKIKVQF
jgi:hypothetical protein